ncbi:MAG: hypothetical protein KF812_01120 [Fimbriimonadaceae bacterium]|nr:hypothetical protein [Fimbriimonadaceae bacterium]
MVALLLGALLQSGSALQSQEGVSQLVSRMLKVYADTKQLDGQIVLSASDGQGTTKMTTDIAYNAPSKILVRQVAPGTEGRTVIVVSNGQKFVYTAPDYLHDTTLLEEPVNANGFVRQYRDIFGVVGPSLIDRSVPLMILIAQPDDLREVVRRLVTVDDQGTLQVNGKSCRLIGGTYREVVGGATFSRYRMAVDENAQLVQFVLQQTYGGASERMTLNLVWDVNVRLGIAPDESRFRLP